LFVLRRLRGAPVTVALRFKCPSLLPKQLLRARAFRFRVRDAEVAIDAGLALGAAFGVPGAGLDLGTFAVAFIPGIGLTVLLTARRAGAR